MSSLRKYLPALIVAMVAVFGLVTALISFSGTKADYTALSAQFETLGLAASQATKTSITEKDYSVCIASSSAEGVIKATAQSLKSVGTGTCRLPDVEVDLAPCIALKPVPVVPTETVTEVASTPEAPAEVATETVPAEPVAPPVVVEIPPAAPAPEATVASEAVEAAIGPVIALVKTLSAQIEDPKLQGWATGVLTWLDSGRATIAALIVDPSSGKLSLKGVDIEGCTVAAE